MNLLVLACLAKKFFKQTQKKISRNYIHMCELSAGNNKLHFILEKEKITEFNFGSVKLIRIY